MPNKRVNEGKGRTESRQPAGGFLSLELVQLWALRHGAVVDALCPICLSPAHRSTLRPVTPVKATVACDPKLGHRASRSTHTWVDLLRARPTPGSTASAPAATGSVGNIPHLLSLQERAATARNGCRQPS